MREHILFDLDGTLTESGPGIINSARHALVSNGHPDPGDDVLRGFVGPPLQDNFRTICGLTDEQVVTCVASFRARFSEKGIHENALYPGIRALLEKLLDAGKTLHVATSKPLVLAERVLNNFDIAKYFASASGVPLELVDKSKADVIRDAMAEQGIRPENAAMVGDRLYDIEGAKANGILPVGVLYGYGSRAELEAAGARLLAENTDDLYAILVRAEL